ncbi:major facilitator superfamily domain-containing protein [Stachybotrys elegans]|uniref:Major facilitator superfamily domain-containing protein n=1 Tax=Stachybotrys elegans TaxID=80388 RepID=A0A8K0T0I2_9HYPO|nr:major facilitator superfamily domain-containing protein [Stachybotrys elegans]
MRVVMLTGLGFASHLVVMNTWGWINSFGVFQAYYADTLGRPPSDISWIGSLATFLLFFVGTLTGRLTDAGYFRVVFAIGTVLLLLGIFTMSVSHTYWQFMLSQGLCMGLGNGFLFCPTLAILASYFLRKRAIAVGIAACGSATGGIVYPIMVRQLLPSIGFAWTVRAIGFIQFVTMVVANVISKPRLKPRRTGPLVEWSAFKEPEYTFYAFGAFSAFLGVYFAFFYLAAYARQALSPPLSYTDSLNVLLILNGMGVVGRLVPNYMADRVGAINMFIPAVGVTAALAFAWMGVSTPAGMYGWTCVYGIFASAIQSLFPAALATLTTDLRKIGVRIGMVFTIVSFAVLLGTPVAGAIVDSPAGFRGAQAFAASVLMAGCGLLVMAKMAKMRRTGTGWLAKV